MIREDYCSSEISKLLKEKGFDVELQCYSYDAVTKENVDIYWQKNINGLLPRCTHQMAMKWLRGKDVDIIIMPLFKLKGGRIYCYEIHSDNTDIRTGQFKTYEEAVEAALKYCLTELI